MRYRLSMTFDTDAEPRWHPDYAAQIVKLLFRLKQGDVVDVDAVSLEPEPKRVLPAYWP